MIVDSTHDARLHHLEFWQGPISTEPLPGGITNYNYLVHDGGRRYVARLCLERPLLGIDRRNEIVCQRAAAGAGIAPEVVYHDNGILVSQHVPGQTLTAADVREPALLSRLAALLRQLHGSWDALTGEMLYFSAFQAVRTYARTARRLNAHLPADLDLLLEDARWLARLLGPFVPVLCHNDLLPGNIIAEPERVWLVDWEYAGIGHPLFDLANLSANCGFSEEHDERLLVAYRGALVKRDLRDLRLLKPMSFLREALWSVIQTVSSEIAFDYVQYADTNFAAYRRARSQVLVAAADGVVPRAV